MSHKIFRRFHGCDYARGGQGLPALPHGGGVVVPKKWYDEAWADYVGWQTLDRKTLKRINALIQSIERNGYSSIGNPEPLKGNLTGWLSVRIDGKNRIVFRIEGNELIIASCNFVSAIDYAARNVIQC